MADKREFLGRLVRVDPRSIWPDEARNFTPWLAQDANLVLLGETIGLELQLEAQEQDVGPFRADILCKNVLTSDWVLIENQLERTDHTHLGQLMTYAAGLKAVTIVWVARRIIDEHRAALDWLNEITNENFHFFGLEIELWRIGDSSPAPKFNLVSQPNDWSELVSSQAAAVELTDSKRLQLRFWTAFRAHVEEQDSPIRPTKPLPQNWMNIAIGRAGFGLSAVASLWDSEKEAYDGGEVRAELVMTDPRASDYFEVLLEEKDGIERDVGFPLDWYNPPSTKMAKVFIRRSANLPDPESWPELHAWLLTKLEALYRAFRHRVKSLQLTPPGEANGEAEERIAEAEDLMGLANEPVRTSDA